MSRQTAWIVVVMLVLGLLAGTQMPNSLRNGIEHSMGAPFGLSSWAHFVVFAAIGLMLAMRPLAWPFGRIILLALAFGLLSEGLQFFAVDRHPRVVDVVIDMLGTLSGVAVAKLVEMRSKPA